jgi:hypothetical protein
VSWTCTSNQKVYKALTDNFFFNFPPPTVKKKNFNGIYSNKIHVSFLTDMDDRAAERVRLKAERDEKRRQAEEERLVTNSNEITKNNSL